MQWLFCLDFGEQNVEKLLCQESTMNVGALAAVASPTLSQAAYKYKFVKIVI